MTLVSGAPTGRDDSSSSRPVDSLVRHVPTRADGVQPIGEMAGSGYRVPPSLARRRDGQTVQLTPLLYQVLEAVDGHRTYAEIAELVSSRSGRRVSAENVATLVDGQLRPLGLLTRPDGTEPELRRSNPLLALRMKYAVTDPQRTRRLTAPFAGLFNPVVVVAVTTGFLWLSWWVLFEKGLASATYQAFDEPALLLLVFAVTVLSAGFHEFGHAAGARRGGATPGVMGAGVYLVWPAFYTDVTDSYRLGRAGRIRTDLGGLYFNAIVAVAVAGAWWLTGWDALLLVVATQILQMIRQLTPLVRFDGYHVLADLTGVPDLFQRIKPTLLGILPWRWGDPEANILKPWARAVVTAWVLAVVPLLLFSLTTMVLALPRVLGTAWSRLVEQQAMLSLSAGRGDVVESAARVLAMVAIGFPILATGVILVRLGRSVGTSVWRRTRGKPAQRAIAALVAASLLGGLAWAWWPDALRYRPIEPYDRGTVSVSPLLRYVAGRPPAAGLEAGVPGRTTALWPDGDPRPTARHPRLAMILVPHRATPGAVSSSSSTSPAPSSTSGDQSWVFPFDKPLAPGPGDNQALAVNTKDNSAVYDVAFALVWVEPGADALNINQAYAAASCTNCAAVAVGFQVVLVVGQSHVAVPQNLSVAANYNCVNCLTYALAAQLFVTLDGPMSEAGMKELSKLWQQIAQYGKNIAEVPLDQIQSQIDAYERQILAVIQKDQGSLAPSASPSATPTSTADADPTAAPPTPSATSPSNSAPGDTTSDPSESQPLPTGQTPTASPIEPSPSTAATPEASTSSQPSTSPTTSATSTAAAEPSASP